MESWLSWARGPLFYFCFSFMALGLLRHAVLTAWEVVRTMRRAGDKDLDYGKLASATLAWLFPVKKVRDRFLFSLTSVLFHIAVLIVPLFLAGHVALWARGLGISWPAIPNGLADILTVAAVVTALALVLERAAARSTRALSRVQDYLIPLLVALPFATGFLVMHPALNLFSYQAMLLTHVLSGNLVLLLIPITKLSHMVLIPGVQVVSEVAWHWPMDAGSRLAVTLGKENEPV